MTPTDHTTRKPNITIWYTLIAALLLIDQLSKWLITEHMLKAKIGMTGQGLLDWFINTPERLGFVHIKVTSFFNLVMAWNTGVSFSLFSDAGHMMPYILIAVALAITAIFIVWLHKAQTHWHALSFSMVIAGALGNVIDRARFGAVIDFLDFHAYGYHYPAFNVADMCIVGGVLLLVILSFIFDSKAKNVYPNDDKNVE